MLQHQKALFCFSNDLRLSDNQALNYVLQQCKSVALVYIFNPQDFIAQRYHHASLGKHRLSFIIHSLLDLQQQLHAKGHQLHILFGEPVTVLSELINNEGFSLLGYTASVGAEEQSRWHKLTSAWSGAENSNSKVSFLANWNNSLFSAEQISSLVDAFSSFSCFRRKLEKSLLTVAMPCETWPQRPVQALDLSLASQRFKVSDVWLSDNSAPTGTFFKAGEQAAQAHLTQYFLTSLPHSYKATRNALDGFDNSTKFSPYLAHGNLSARQIWSALKHFELEQGPSDSSYWIGFELLWREYFHWLALRLGKALFQFKGLAATAPLTSYFPERFTKWCLGCTPYPLVNACMKQLNATGYMSNRGRQIVASCLVHELGLDWRYGAAYFEQQLVDYDVASNWGNWQYIAGVGVDPRGGRHFNLQKQTEIYDPDGEFIAKWQGEVNSSQALDSVDAADWPLQSDTLPAKSEA
ncbi:DASH family cryptochrome [Shewanella pneumatophori]|uniref:Cryptochrome DASH n=1 Tax=Shewanella pneumatophori TaxID=314092 RepID=A0A9X1ZDL3_9GAMM|nr:DASH family cryptochrome [Shewanella pneumatophori]MCL1137872.1 DASH family cryptochrome [Shewanella pneumatophori]